jgi:hypothetical protein
VGVSGPLLPAEAAAEPPAEGGAAWISGVCGSAAAVGNGQSTPVQVSPVPPHGWGKYRFCLDNEIGRIGFTASRRLPLVRVQPRAEFLQAVGPEETVRHFDQLLRPFVEGMVLSVARLDLFLDVQGVALCAADRKRSCAGPTTA